MTRHVSNLFCLLLIDSRPRRSCTVSRPISDSRAPTNTQEGKFWRVFCIGAKLHRANLESESASHIDMISFFATLWRSMNRCLRDILYKIAVHVVIKTELSGWCRHQAPVVQNLDSAAIHRMNRYSGDKP